MRLVLPLLLAAAFLAIPRASAQEAKAPPKFETVLKELDSRILAVWKEAKVKPAKRLDDASFFRRLSLDLAGRIPSEDVARGLSSRRHRATRAELVDAVIHSRDYARFMAIRWGNLLVGRTVLARSGSRPPLTRWLETQFAGNVSWSEIVQDLLTAEGPVSENGATQYLLAYRNKPEELAGNAMRVFQAQQVQCAQCHDHPYKDAWKQKDFWAVSAFFARIGVRREGMIDTVFEREEGEVRIPGVPGKRGPIVAPRFVTGESIDPGEGAFRRDEVARILTGSRNPYFVRATVNRVWSFLFGEGFTDPNDLATPDHESVLEVLEEDFRSSGHDLRRLIRLIVLSRAYGVSASGALKAKVAQEKVLARARLRPLNLEQLWTSTLDATGVEEVWAKMPAEKRLNQRRNLRRAFYSVFLRHEDAALEEYSLGQALWLLNGPMTNALLPAQGPLMRRLLGLDRVEEQISTLYLRVLGRQASKSERKALARGAAKGDRVAFLQDLAWGLLNSSEFLFNR
ncbi:MAG: DUF1553 domain-containing protein [Planctomycetes bacterium]|nr:DUF1553 domain-containing protein [Planctomycetota bacterium]